jgi:phenylpropionate dioxygenase-like ring-hydroxylating dioxygenase large terminal subunit
MVVEGVRVGVGEGVVDRGVYTDPGLLEVERDLIFARTWQFACTVHDLKVPGDFFTVSVADQPVLVVRGADGVIRAFFNACTHRGAVLTGDRCGNYGQVLKCMYHAWAFSLSGELVGVPYEEGYGPGFDRGGLGLVPVRCETFFDLVFVALDPVVGSLVEFLGPMAEHLGPYVDGIEPIGRNSWVYEGNWKLWHENFRDNYHPEFTHRSIHDMTPHYADRGGNWGIEGGHSVLQWIAEAPNMPNYARSLKRHSGVSFEDTVPSSSSYSTIAEAAKEVPQEVLAVFPNFDIQPGPKDKGRGMKAGYIQTVTPVTLDTARVDITIYSSVDDDEETRQRNLEGLADSQGSWGKISCDDTEAAYRCQVGLRGQGTASNIFTRGVEPGGGGQDAQARDEYSQRAFYRTYFEYLGRAAPTS